MPPLGKDAQLATGVASPSSAQTALARLVERGLAERADDTILTDPLFSIWLAREHAG